MSVLVLFGVLFLALLIGVPVSMSLGLASVATLVFFTDQSLLSLAQKFFHTMHIYPLLAVPFFILAGAFMTSGGMAQRLIDFANAIVGHYKGGLPWPRSLDACSLQRSRAPRLQRLPQWDR